MKDSNPCLGLPGVDRMSERLEEVAMGVCSALPIIAMIALSGCTQNVEASDPTTTVQQYAPIETDIVDMPIAETTPEEATRTDQKQPAMRSPVDFD